MTPLAWVVLALGVGLLGLAFDFQRRWFEHRSTQREHERTVANDLLTQVAPMIASQAERDQRNKKALELFLTEMRDGIKSLTVHAQKQSTETVSKLQAMGRMGAPRGR